MRTTAKLLFTLIFSTLIGMYAFAGASDSNDEFIKHTELRNGKNHFAIDMSSFDNRFEQVYFIMQLYHYNEVVVTSSDPESKSFKITAEASYPVSHIQTMVNGIRTDTNRKAEELTAQQEAQWLEENDKFKRK